MVGVGWCWVGMDDRDNSVLLVEINFVFILMNCVLCKSKFDWW